MTCPVHVGTSGWYYRDWRSFYPKGLPKTAWLSYYASLFDTVELNSSFYGIPKPGVFRGWAHKVPPGFLFAVKAPQDLTHRRDQDPQTVLESLLSGARELGEHLGPILYQLPPWLTRDLDYLEHFLALLPLGLDHVIEFRHASWYEPEVQRQLKAAHVGVCIHDMHGSASPMWQTGPVIYCRFHGPTSLKYQGRYGTERLRLLGEQLLALAETARCVYIFFNNTAAGAAVADAVELRDLVTGSGRAAAATSLSPDCMAQRQYPE
jgi:uncharacterized protein YecE (DUF72 family)